MVLKKSTKLKCFMVFGGVAVLIIVWMYLRVSTPGTTKKLLLEKQSVKDKVRDPAAVKSRQGELVVNKPIPVTSNEDEEDPDDLPPNDKEKEPSVDIARKDFPKDPEKLHPDNDPSKDKDKTENTERSRDENTVSKNIEKTETSKDDNTAGKDMEKTKTDDENSSKDMKKIEIPMDAKVAESKKNATLAESPKDPKVAESPKDPKVPESPKDIVIEKSDVDMKKCSIKRKEDRFNCFPEKNPSKEKCEKRGCCWIDDDKVKIRNNTDNIDTPWCFFPLGYVGYRVENLLHSGTSYMHRLQLLRDVPSPYPKDVKTLNMDIIFETDTRLRIKIYDPEHQRFVPLSLSSGTKAASPKYEMKFSGKGQPLQFSVLRKENQEVLLNTSNAASFIFSDQFIQLSYFLPSYHLYGLGEHRANLSHSFNRTILTMWNRDQPPKENSNLYGSHPFYMMMEKSGRSHGVLLLNSNAMDVVLQPSPAITWRTIGGIVDLYFFLGPNPDDVISQYTDLIGRTFLPPYWSLGFHLCRWGYKTANRTLEIMDRVRKYNIPQDVQWNDMDYAKDKMDFTTNKETFGDQPGLVEEIHKRGMHYVIITDAGISSNQTVGTYRPYDLGKQLDIFIKNASGDPLVGRVWPPRTVFPDFTHPKANEYWKILIQGFHSIVKFDGLWIDMNELSNFVNGSIDGCPENSTLEHPPYLPHVLGDALSAATICPSALHNISTEYNLHNLYGLYESFATNHALKETRVNRRPFVISRSTFPGQGHYGGHWTGDNFALFHDMHKSIAQILNFNMFGIPMVGADICGFNLNTTAQLCQRWLQLGAFYPFSRNHNEQGNIDQDPGAFGEAVANSTAEVFKIRYKLLPYLYTLFLKSHAMGYTVARPLFFEFPLDKECLSIDRQFLWGQALLITPVLEENATDVKGYFPKATWYSFHTGEKVNHTETYIKLSAPLNFINLHVRGGFILPMQHPGLTTTESREKPFILLVALNNNGMATGDLYWDDGDSPDSFKLKKYNYLQFTTKNQALSSKPQIGYRTKMVLDTVYIFGVNKKPSTVTITVNSSAVNFSYNNSTQNSSASGTVKMMCQHHLLDFQCRINQFESVM